MANSIPDGRLEEAQVGMESFGDGPRRGRRVVGHFTYEEAGDPGGVSGELCEQGFD